MEWKDETYSYNGKTKMMEDEGEEGGKRQENAKNERNWY